MGSKMTGVIVLGGHVQGYGIIRIFGINSIPTIVLDTSKYNIARHSKYCQDFYQVSYHHLIELLIQFKHKKKYENWILIPTDDYYVKILSQNKSKLNKYYKVAVDDWNIIKSFYNKRYTYPLVANLEIPIPKTYYPQSYNDIQFIARNVSYPCIVKPAIMLDFYRHFKKKVFLCRNAAELKINYQRVIKVIKPDEILIQKVIPGGSEQQYSVGVFFDRNKSYNYIVVRRKRQHPPDFGHATTFAETVNLPILVDYAEKILSHANFSGLCEVEFKYDQRDDKFKFLEVNPRTWKWHLISEPGTIPFLLSLYNYYTTGNPIKKKNYKESSWKDIITDLPMVIKSIIKGDYINSNATNTIHAVMNKKDIKPFLFQLLYLPLLIVKR